MRTNLLALIITLILFAAPVIGGAQTPDQDRQAVGTDLVNLNVTVTDRAGGYVSGLSREQFQVFDNGVRQDVAFFSGQGSPAMIGIVYDMHPTTVERTRANLNALRQFVATLRPEDRYFIVTFNEYGSLVLDFIPTPEQVQTHLSTPSAQGPNSLYDAVDLAAGKIRESPFAQRALLVISDGEDHHSQLGYAAVRERIRGFNVQIFSVTLPVLVSGKSDRWEFEDLTNDSGRRNFLERTEAALGRAVLDELARISGGTAYPEARSARELVAVCTQIAYELREQYSLAFYPTDRTNGNRPHELLVTVQPGERAKGNLSLTYRRSYQLIPQG